MALHLDRCPDCRREFDLGRVELDPAVFESLSESRRQALVAALAGARSAANRRRVAIAAAAIAALASTLILTSITYFGDTREDSEETVATALVEDHIRYLRSPEREMSEASAKVVVELQSYVDFPLRVPDLAEGRLTGDRKCYILGRRVALLFYDTAAGAVSYFVLEGGDLGPPGRICGEGRDLACCELQGYRVMSWKQAGLLHAVVGPDSPALERAVETVRSALEG